MTGTPNINVVKATIRETVWIGAKAQGERSHNSFSHAMAWLQIFLPLIILLATMTSPFPGWLIGASGVQQRNGEGRLHPDPLLTHSSPLTRPAFMRKLCGDVKFLYEEFQSQSFSETNSLAFGQQLLLGRNGGV